MRPRTLYTLVFLITLVLPTVTSAATIWKSTPSHPDETPVYSATTPRWYETTGKPASSIGTWNKSDFTTTANTTVHVWARWNNVYLSTLDIRLHAAVGGDPFYGTGSTTAKVIRAPLGFYELNMSATSTPREYSIPVNTGVTIHQGDALWLWMVSSWRAYGSSNWVGSNGTLPYIEICEGACVSSAPTITLLGSATTTAEFGSSFTDPGATALDTLDDDITNSIHVTGSVDTNSFGTTTLTYAVTNSQGLSATTTRAVIVACTHDCNSSVLFLPGIESSRLYRPNYNGGADKLWEPNIDSDVQDLYMNPDGTSKRFDVYTKERDVLDELPNGENIYKSFIGKIDDLKTNGKMADWEPIAYDWRLSLDDILNYGNDVQGRIYYSGDLRATSTPYIIQELKRLAATSKTGKVTIVAHSNGGLLAKRLTEVLGPTEASRLIDNMIFVAVPQAGTPAAIAAGLHGYDQENVWGLVTTRNTARTLAVDASMMYQLLPSASYFTYVDNPVVTFDSSLTDWIAKYGGAIHSQEMLNKFLTDTFGRVDPQTGNINQPTQFNSTLLGSAKTLHTSLDTWTPPTGVQLTQIAGWGIPKTVDGIIYKKKGTGVTPEADLTVDGDGTVVVPSALWTSTTTGAVNYWVNLRSYNSDHPVSSGLGRATFDHSRILETDPVINFISDTLTNVAKSLSDYVYISTEAPTNSDKRLQYSLHSPLTLNLYDAVGHHTGVSTTTGQVEEQIPGTYYLEFGDVKYIFSDASTDGNILMNGYDSGTFTFNVDEYSGDTLTTSTTFKDVPTTAHTTVSLNVQSGGAVLSSMMVDENGDGKNVFTLTPKVGETVSYEPPAPTPAPQTRSTGSGGKHISIPSIIPVLVATTSPTSSLQAVVVASAISTQPVGIHTPVVVATKPLQAKEKVSVHVVPSEKVNTNVSQTVSAYDAFQQSFLQRLGEAFYNGLKGIWAALMRFFY